MKVKLLADAEATIDQFLDWVEKTERPNLTQIEDTVLAFRRHLGETMAETAIGAQVATHPVPGPRCPTCDREMHFKDDQTKIVTSRVSELDLNRSYYYCAHCKQGLFPPRPPTGTLCTHL